MTGMAWHVAFGFVLLVDRGRISGAWRYGLRGVVPVLVTVLASRREYIVHRAPRCCARNRGMRGQHDECVG